MDPWRSNAFFIFQMTFFALYLFYLMFTIGVLMVMAPLYWVFDIFSSYVPIFTAASVVTILLLVFYRRFMQAAIIFVLVGYLSITLVIQYLPPEKPVTSPLDDRSTKLSVMQVNVNFRNTAYQKLLDSVGEERPSVIVINEATPGWSAELETSLKSEYPYFITESSETYQGMIVVSQLPIRMYDVIRFSEASAPILKVEFREPAMTLFAVHALSPVSEQWALERDGLLHSLVPILEQTDGMIIVAGDLNATVHSTAIRGLLHDANLHDARRGFGWNATWMRNPPLAAAIDHVLYRGSAEVRDVRVLPDIGSDHRPLLVDMTIYPTELL